MNTIDVVEYNNLVAISQSLQKEYQDENKQWSGSPFEWIKYRPSRSIGAIGEKIVTSWLAMHDFNVARSPDSEADRVVENMRVEINLVRNGRTAHIYLSRYVIKIMTLQYF